MIKVRPRRPSPSSSPDGAFALASVASGKTLPDPVIYADRQRWLTFIMDARVKPAHDEE